ncbi:velvet factor [Gorgonomyces haynaldii]|nr:velvet factor [Gorgonomyces haynaldii]
MEKDPATFDLEGVRCRLSVRQHPTQARMSGFSHRDHRHLDPTPIVQLEILDKLSLADTLNSGFPNFTSLIVHTSLYHADYTPFYNSHTPRASPVSVLMGSLVSSCSLLVDEHGQRGFFFVFPDLAIRSSGSYRLKFSLFDIQQSLLAPNSKCLASVFSEPFTVYSPKTFPGMKDSTAIIQAFARQGVKVQVRAMRDRDTLSDGS